MVDSKRAKRTSTASTSISSSRVSLTWKTVERISFALDLIPMHTAVDHGKVNSGDALTQPQFVKNQGVIFMLMKTTNLGIQATPDINVSDLRHGY